MVNFITFKLKNKNMRNMYLLPTKKKSHLCSVGLTTRTREKNMVVPYEGLHFSSSGVYSSKNFDFISYMNLYITSDEGIKEGDWCYRVGIGPFKPKKEDKLPKHYGYKIILTTDPEFIKDGVQEIPRDFLEWFVKNPSCGEVKIEKYHGIQTSIAEISAISGNDDYNWKGIGDYRDYKIIIPKEEEPKQYEKNPEFYGNGIFNRVVESKQETLEDAAELYKKLYEFRIKKEQTQRKEGFIDGAKWYQERSYTIEDLKNAFEGGHISARQKASYKSNGTYYEDLNDWIHEYKKK